MRPLLLLMFLLGDTFGASQFGTPFYLHAYGGGTQMVTQPGRMFTGLIAPILTEMGKPICLWVPASPISQS